MIDLLQYLGAGVSLILGLIAVFSPRLIEKFISIQGTGKEGQSEIRATYGGFFIGISLFAILSQNQVVYITLGIGWVCAAFIRMITIVIGSYTPKNLAGVLFESLIGLLCLSSYLLT